MNKRILTLVLAFVMILGLAVTSFAAPEVEKITNPKVQWLVDKNIVEGRKQDDESIKYDLDKTITREEVTKLVVIYRGNENLARQLKGTRGAFNDVTIEKWSNGFINVAYQAKLIKGYGDKIFGPERDITYAELATILVRMDSRWTAADEDAAKGQYPAAFMQAAAKFGILEGITIEDADKPAVREIAFEMMYNAFDGKYQKPIVNDRLGVISKVWGNSIQLNGKDEYKITDKTIFVGDTLDKLFKTSDFFGSLVRIAVNNENEITHLVALGSNGFAYTKDKWEGLIDEVNGDVYVVKSNATPNPADITDKSNNEKVVFAGGTTLKITKNTRFFVADKAKNNFFEAAKLTDAIDVDEVTHLTGVYAAYDKQPVTGDLFAKVVVFSSGKAAPANKNLVRITNSVAAGYDFKAENTKGTETEYNVAKANKFPYNYKLRKMDVVNLHMGKDADVVDFETVIDYDKAPVFEVVKVGDARTQSDGSIKFEGNVIRLKDKHDKELDFAVDVDGVKVFTNALGKGAKVQLAYSDKAKQVINVVSIVDKKVDGEFDGYVPGKHCGILQALDGDQISILEDGKQVGYKIGTFEAGALRADVAAKALPTGSVFGSSSQWTDAATNKHPIKDMNIKICFIAPDAKEEAVHSVEIQQETIDAVKACQTKADEYKTAVAAGGKLDPGTDQTTSGSNLTAISSNAASVIEGAPNKDKWLAEIKYFEDALTEVKAFKDGECGVFTDPTVIAWITARENPTTDLAKVTKALAARQLAKDAMTDAKTLIDAKIAAIKDESYGAKYGSPANLQNALKQALSTLDFNKLNALDLSAAPTVTPNADMVHQDITWTITGIAPDVDITHTFSFQMDN